MSETTADQIPASEPEMVRRAALALMRANEERNASTVGARDMASVMISPALAVHLVRAVLDEARDPTRAMLDVAVGNPPNVIMDAYTQLPSYEELSVVSLDAAIELDRLRRGEKVLTTATEKLIENLGLRPNGIGTADALQHLADPRTVDIYNRTVFHLTRIQASTIEELADEVRKYAEGFGRDLPSVNADDLLAMRNFCLALHREFLAEMYDRHSWRDMVSAALGETP